MARGRPPITPPNAPSPLPDAHEVQARGLVMQSNATLAGLYYMVSGLLQRGNLDHDQIVTASKEVARLGMLASRRLRKAAEALR